MSLLHTATALDFNSEGTPEDLARLLVALMSDKQALGQTFMVSWEGSAPTPEVLVWIRERFAGGIKAYGWNAHNTDKLAQTIGQLQGEALKNEFHIPLLAATDQEGGWVRHIKGDTSETPGNMAIGASSVPRDAYLSGYYIGRELAAIGINMNFAPLVDLYTNRDSLIIGTRSFGTDPVQVGLLGVASFRGQLAAGIIPTAKHYPGHGDTRLDSHGILPQIVSDFDQLWERELLPFRYLVKEGVPVIMSGHLAFPNTQAGKTSASLSPWFMQDVLREKIGFKGLVITDDLMMYGAQSQTGGLSRTVKAALLAGNDIVLFSRSIALDNPIWDYLLHEMKVDSAFNARVFDAARRVVQTKLQYLKNSSNPIIPDAAQLKTSVPNPESKAFFLSLAARSATVVKNANNAFPLRREAAGNVLLAGRYEEFIAIGKQAYPGASGYLFDYGGYAWKREELQRLARDSDTVIFCLGDEDDLKLLQSLKGLHKRVLVLSVLSPVYLDKLEWIDGAIAVYSYVQDSFVSGFSVLLGRLNAGGKVPFPLDEPRWVPPQSKR
ncbi:glycosyl hydrolase [Spirochaetia bacterium]|nr:glycosyl hydrolase [Spirochaetia bacterium]